ncbi:uncharacterized protein LOC135346105 isoform X2 [Halichondria panicea]|uniref:uncharacterized protein LOC135346105 isoform X2 n=1 Tax=Halichondria panicea TaxID=6063 RepID=UPI00312B91F3
MTSLKQSGEHARTSLKVLQTLTYNCTGPDRLDQLATKLDTLITEFRAILPKTEGLILRPQARFSARKKTQQIKHKYLNLTSRLKRGRPKSYWKYRNRVGQKADALRKKDERAPESNTRCSGQRSVQQSPVKHMVKALRQAKEKLLEENAPSTLSHKAGEKKRKRCNEWSECKKEDCGSCHTCKDMLKFGGSGRKKQCCQYRKCRALKSANVLGLTLKQSGIQTCNQDVKINTSVNMKNSTSFLMYHGRKIDQVLGDGNCLFRVLAKQLTGDSDKHGILRDKLCEFITVNSELLEGWVTAGVTLEEHLASVTKPNTWGTQLELKAAATLFNLDIYVATNYIWTMISPLKPVSSCCFLDKEWLIYFNSQRKSWLEICHQNGCHYDCINSIQCGKNITILPPPLKLGESANITIL